MEDTLYHVVLEGRKVGPYDRRTIVGMRIKKTLTGDHLLIGDAGGQLTVGELIGEEKPRSRDFNPQRSGSFSIVQATYCAVLAGSDASAAVPRFVGDVEARIQNGMLRLAGRFRKRFGWRDDRVKVPIRNILQTRIRGSVVEMWLHDEKGGPARRVALDMKTPDLAAELLQWMPDATPYADPPGQAPRATVGHPAAVTGIVVAAVGAMAGLVVLAVVLIAILGHH